MILVMENLELVVEESVRKLGYSSIRDEQKRVILSFVKGNDVVACLPTGYGKSLCYFCLPFVFDELYSVKLKDSTDSSKDSQTSLPWSVVVVVSPLLALMHDQVSSLRAKGATVVIASNNPEDGLSREVLQMQIVSRKFQFIFTTPELLLLDKSWIDIFQSPSLSERIVSLVIDEAHCIKKWYVNCIASIHYYTHKLFFRGTDFRKKFGKLGDLRGFFPNDVKFMALSATMSKKTRREVIRILGMHKPVIIAKNPDKINIVYSVYEKVTEMDDVFDGVIEELRVKRLKMDKVIIFCRTYRDCSDLFLLFKRKLMDEITDPIGHANISRFRIVDMFTACNTTSLKKSILASFSKPNGRLRIVIATVAFGMGIDCPNVRRIFHWGPPSDLEMYIQTGRAGRDGQVSFATLFYNKRDISFSFMEEEITKYCTNVQACRRELLFANFELCSTEKPIGCSCCDLCAIHCTCPNCQF